MSKINSEVSKKLKEGYESGLSLKELSATHSISAFYIRTILQSQDVRIKHGKQGTSSGIPSEETILKNIARENKKLEIIRMYKAGKSFDEIGRYFGCSRQNIFMMLKKDGIKKEV
jgi:Mor family transcriptional regulator